MFQVPVPNFTQTPNILFDDWLPKLGMAELKVLMVIMRKTFGWHKIKDRISLSQLQQITGLERTHVIKGVKGLVEKSLIIKMVTGKKGSQETYYELVVADNSNNFDQCRKDTPPSVVKTPTKETLTKEKERREEAAPPPPPSFYIHKRVMMVSEKFDKLVEEFGIDKIKEMMERLDEYADINPKRFKQYACHAAVIRKWIREDTSKGKKVDLKASKAASEAWSEGENRSWWNKMATLLKPYERDGFIYSGSSYVEFSRPGKYPIKIYFNYPDFVKVAKELLKDLEIMV